MNIDVLKNGGIDYDDGIKRFVGRAQLYEKVLSKFPNDQTFAHIAEDYAANDKERLLLDAHEFKGMCGNIALHSLYHVSDTLVKLLRSGDYTESELDAAYTALAQEYAVVKAAVLAAMEE